MTALVAVETLLLALVVLLMLGLLRSHAEILRRVHAPDGHAHESAAEDEELAAASEYAVRPKLTDPVDIEGEDLYRRRMTVPVASSGQPHLLAFLSGGCSVCEAIWDELQNYEDLPLPNKATVVLVAKGRNEESISRLRRLMPPYLTVVLSSKAWEDYRVPGSPYFVYVGESGSIEGEGSARSWSRAMSLLEDAIGDARIEAEEPLESDMKAMSA